MKFVWSLVAFAGMVLLATGTGCNQDYFGLSSTPSVEGQAAAPPKTETAVPPPPPPAPVKPPEEPKKVQEGLTEEALEALREKVRASLVWIDTDCAYGSGFVVDKEGTIVTSALILEKMSQGEVTFDDRQRAEITATYIPPDGNGLALVRTARTQGFSPLALSKAFPREKDIVVGLGGCQGLFSAPAQGLVARICPGSEVRSHLKADGVDSKRLEKLDADATWIETTAVVRPTNVGGPLVDPEGQVLGVNLWSTKTGQPHYALTARHVPRLLEKKSEFLAVHAPAGGSIAKPEITGDLTSSKASFRIQFPSGNILDSKILDSDRRNMLGVVDQWSSNSNSVTTLRYASGAVFAMTSYRQGRLNGQTVAFYEDNSPLTTVNYLNSDKHGWLQTWDAEGRRVLWSHYRFDKRHGLVCLFQDDALKVVVESVLDEPKTLYLFSENRCVESWEMKELGNASPSSRASQWVVRLDKLLEEISRNERMFKLQVQDNERIVRQGRVATLTPMKRQSLQLRINQRQEDHDAMVNILRNRGWLASQDGM